MSAEPNTNRHPLRKQFLSGLAVGAPLVLTLWVIWTFIVTIDGWVMPLVPRSTIPLDSMWRTVPGVGVVIFLLCTIALGQLAKGIIGRTLIRLGETLITRLPLINKVYTTIKQIVDTVLGTDNPKFEQACLVEYPRKGVWVVAFISTHAKGEIAEKLRRTDDDTIVSVFVPTTPNPTSGFLLLCPMSELIILDMGIDDAAKLTVSAGLVYPQDSSDHITMPPNPLAP